MTKVYNAIPTQQEWAKDMKTTGLISHTKFPAFDRISDLLGMYYSVDHRLRALRHELLLQTYRHTGFILKHKDNKVKLGTSLSNDRAETVRALRDYLNREHNVGDLEYAVELSKPVCEHGQEEDERAVHHDAIQWYATNAARKQFKLSFRNGLANRWGYTPEGGKTGLTVYDTVQAGDAIENGMSLYVMDTTGRLYVSGKEGEKSLKHSSFLAGAMTLAAGTLRVENGQVVQVSGRSGHYRPTVQQMLNVLERLRAYQVDLSKLTVLRENFTGAFDRAEPRFMEPVPALKLLQLRAWPGVEPYSMRVG